ncbi:MULTISPECIES: signal peptidase I [Lysinibacillus]|uniref:signal peptidase I n=1 Tax=Lysinibacillus TaxID=400634 RepID=UPI00083C9F2B|nr:MULTISPECIES: signal peptidase I [Lysinibacillus]
MKYSRTFKYYIISSIICIFLVCVISLYFYKPILSIGESMKPTLGEWSILLVKKHIKQYERFDVVNFKLNDNGYVKRIIALPGEHIAFKNDALFINGDKIDEPHLAAYKENVYNFVQLTLDFTLEDISGEIVIPEGYYFVMGDNRRYSTDSRDQTIGFILEENIVGRVDILLLPLSDLNVF